MAGKIIKMISSFPCFQAKNTDPFVQHRSNFSASHIFKLCHYETPWRAVLCCWKKTIIAFWFSSLMMKPLTTIISLEREHALVTKLRNGTKRCIISYLLESHTHTTTITSHSVAYLSLSWHIQIAMKLNVKLIGYGLYHTPPTFS